MLNYSASIAIYAEMKYCKTWISGNLGTEAFLDLHSTNSEYSNIFGRSQIESLISERFKIFSNMKIFQYIFETSAHSYEKFSPSVRNYKILTWSINSCE